MVVACSALQAQKQLILLKRQTVVARFSEGEYFSCQLKDKSKKEGRLLRLEDAFLVTSNDTILFETIYRINVKGKRKVDVTSGVGGLLFIGGIGYFAIDQVNSLLFIKSQQGLDKGVTITSLAMAGTGALILFTRSKYQKIRGLSFRTIDPNSRFYQYP